MDYYEVDPERSDGFIATTTDGLRLQVSRSETGDHNNVRLGLGEERGNQFFELLPSHARELGKHLLDTASALDGDYPEQANR